MVLRNPPAGSWQLSSSPSCRAHGQVCRAGFGDAAADVNASENGRMIAMSPDMRWLPSIKTVLASVARRCHIGNVTTVKNGRRVCTALPLRARVACTHTGVKAEWH